MKKIFATKNIFPFTVPLTTTDFQLIPTLTYFGRITNFYAFAVTILIAIIKEICFSCTETERNYAKFKCSQL